MRRHEYSGNYIAESLREIAAHFDRLAEKEDAVALGSALLKGKARRLAVRRDAMLKAETWRQAARILETTVLAPTTPD